jgi:hypothetical protein
MIRGGWIALPLLAATVASWAADSEVSPKDFAYGMGITVPAPAAAYRVAIPLEIYQKIVHEDLSDLRVFNARGEVVPHEIQQPQPEPAPRPPEPSLPLFPLRGDARAALDGVRVTVQSQGTAVHVQAGAAAAESQAINGYVLDARELTLPVLALKLHWPDGEPEFSGAIRVESSDDLGSWHLVRSDAPVVNLRTGDAELVQDRLELPPTKAKFWRLAWVGRSAPFELASVTADLTSDRQDSEHATLIVAGNPVNDQSPEYSFDLGARLPTTRINIELPESNSVGKIQLFSRARATDAWRPITHGEFYRVQSTSSERRNEGISIPRNPDRYWLARLDPSTGPIGKGAPKLEVTWNAEDVAFLARGGGPYLLAYGNSSAVSGNASLSSLLSGVAVLRARLEAPRPLGGSARLLPPPRAFPWKLAILWVVLGLAVALLAWMAYRLSRELKKSG